MSCRNKSADRKREAENALQVKLLEALGSGEPVAADAGFWRRGGRFYCGLESGSGRLEAADSRPGASQDLDN